MHRIFLAALICLGSFAGQAVANPQLEQSIKDSALMYGGYGDESVICGGDLLNYKIVSETQSEVTVKVLITEQIGYCESIIQAECIGTYTKNTKSYSEKSFKCDQ